MTPRVPVPAPEPAAPEPGVPEPGVPAAAPSVLDVRGLTVSFPGDRASGRREVVRAVDLTVEPGQCVAIVGESGSGKSVTARALLGLAGPGSLVRADHLVVAGADRRGATERDWRRTRGVGAGLVLQDALVSLDPLRTIGREIGDPLRIHRRMSHATARARAIELLELVGMPHPTLTVDRRSGELSGGMRQRALIASALALDPPLLIADEPTTALDVGVQARVLGLLDEARSRGTGVLLISHDLAVVSRIADRVIVLDQGTVVEQGPTGEILGAPRHPITRALIAAVPTEVPRGRRLVVTERPEAPGAVREHGQTDATATATAEPTTAKPTTADAVHDALGSAGGAAPALEGIGLSKSFRAGAGTTHAVQDVSFRVEAGRTLGLVGESGSGKTTLARLALGLTAPDAGEVRLAGEPWAPLPERDRTSRRSRIGAVYQDAFGSFDPRWSVRRILGDALAAARHEATDAAITALLDQVHVPADAAARHPLALSGGQRQRVAIARALAGSPEVLVCDEPVSALDATVQARVLDLLDELQREHGLALLFVSHDLGVIRHMSDTVAVMRNGRIVEHGETERVFTAPEHEITAALIRDAPRLVRGGGPASFR
ncbi:peptide/nickel transport system ATP-binding protein [Agromyces sp. CF514]|uniref:dipeptide ABC transporter ATP-binding protein n=1 Tax=Agromyces sp. CF514 TaxID=1881031 RepID=UPI0008DF8278|nr:ABC transporter ATP-binding protein [Agromyces sp. CF514]SFR77256.1 peptide/nickel transport system ATP-binding protein [Agromyces sp. CF514]